MEEIKSLAEEVVASPDISDKRLSELANELERLKAERPGEVVDIYIEDRQEALSLLKHEIFKAMKLK